MNVLRPCHRLAGCSKPRYGCAMIKSLRALPPALILAVLMIVATGLRLWALSAWPLWSDEGWSKWISAMGWREMWATVRAYETHPPFYYSILHLWQSMFGADIMALRSLSLVAGIALLPLGYAVAQRAAVHPLVMVALMVVSRPLLIAARQARPYALLVLAFTGAMWALLRLKRGENGWRLWLIYLACFETVLWLHAVGVFFGTALGLAMLIGLRRAQWLKFVVIHTLAALMWLPCLQMILIQSQHRLHSWLVFDWGNVWPWLVEGFAGDQNSATGLIALLLSGLGVAALRARGERAIATSLLILTLVPVCCEILISATKTPVFLPRYFMPSVVPMLLLVSASLSHPRYGKIAGYGLAVLALFMSVTTVREITREPEERWDAIGAYLHTHVRRGEEVWAIPNDLKMYLGYSSTPDYPVVAQPAPFPAPDYPGARPAGTMAVPALDGASVTRMIAEARARHRTGLWIISSHLWLFDVNDDLHKQLRAVAVRDPATTDISPVVIEHWVFTK